MPLWKDTTTTYSCTTPTYSWTTSSSTNNTWDCAGSIAHAIYTPYFHVAFKQAEKQIEISEEELMNLLEEE